MGVLIAYSSSAHRNLDLLPTREVPDRTGYPCRTTSLRCARPHRPRHCAGSPCRALRRTEGPGGTHGGGSPGRGRPRRGAHKHPVLAAYRVDRGRKRPHPPRRAADRSWPLAPDTPHRCVRGMRGLASGQTRLSLPPRTDLSPDKWRGKDRTAVVLSCIRRRSGARAPCLPSGEARTVPVYSPSRSRSASGAVSVSGRMSMRQPVSRAARRAFWPSLPMASDSW